MPIIKNTEVPQALWNGLRFLEEGKFYEKFPSERLWKVDEEPKITGIYRCVYCWHEAYLEKNNRIPPEHVKNAEHCYCGNNTERMLVVGLDNETGKFFCLRVEKYYVFWEGNPAFNKCVKDNIALYNGIYKPDDQQTKGIFFHAGNQVNRFPRFSAPTKWQLILATNAKKNDDLKPVFADE